MQRMSLCVFLPVYLGCDKSTLTKVRLYFEAWGIIVGGSGGAGEEAVINQVSRACGAGSDAVENWSLPPTQANDLS